MWKWFRKPHKVVRKLVHSRAVETHKPVGKREEASDSNSKGEEVFGKGLFEKSQDLSLPEVAL